MFPILIEKISNTFINHPSTNVKFDWKTFGYRKSGPEDDDVEDYENKVSIYLKIPKISFLELLDLLTVIRFNRSCDTFYLTTINPSDQLSMGAWHYFETVTNNVLHRYFPSQKPFNVVFLLEDTGYYVIVKVY